MALAREVPPVATHDKVSQTEVLLFADESVQTDEQASPFPVESKTETITQQSPVIYEDTGTDPISLSYEDAASQTVDALRTPSADAEVQVTIIDDPVPTIAPEVSLVESDPSSQAVPTVDTAVGTDVEDVDISKPVHEDDGQIPDYIQQLHSQDLLDALDERAQQYVSVLETGKGKENLQLYSFCFCECALL